MILILWPTLNFGDRSLWLGDMQTDKKENLYVDIAHYTGEFSAEIAEEISSFILDGNYLK